MTESAAPAVAAKPSERPHAQARDNLRGVTAMIFAVGALSLMDACLKVLAPHYSPFQVASLRGLSAFPFIAIWVGMRGGYRQLLHVRFGLHAIRGGLGILMLATFAFALRSLPLTEAYAIFFVAPLLITILAVVILKEQVDWTRWAAIAIGFLGVLIVLRPTGAGAMTIPGLAILGCAVAYAFTAITVRILGRTDTTESMMFWLTLTVGVGAGLIALPEWRPIRPEHWLVIAGIAVTGSIGQFAITEAFRLGESSLIAPFEYTALAWGVGLDWFVWQTLPMPVTILGALVIIASGIYLVRRERVHVEVEHP
ncbi:MAG TPA: DMT family transporter [Gemmatimonadaceae bacterium]|nr:DMT family transporter [Gemmatimonadaceae bacterium]